MPTVTESENRDWVVVSDSEQYQSDEQSDEHQVVDPEQVAEPVVVPLADAIVSGEIAKEDEKEEVENDSDTKVEVEVDSEEAPTALEANGKLEDEKPKLVLAGNESDSEKHHKSKSNKMSLELMQEFALTCPNEDLYSLISLIAPKEVSGTPRACPIELSLVIDRSGSMAQNSKLELVKRACVFVLHQLKVSDKLGVVIYDDNVADLFPLTVCSEENREWMESAIQNVRPAGCTNLSGGLFRGMQQHFSEGGKGGVTGGSGATYKLIQDIITEASLMPKGTSNRSPSFLRVTNSSNLPSFLRVTNSVNAFSSSIPCPGYTNNTNTSCMVLPQKLVDDLGLRRYASASAASTSSSVVALKLAIGNRHRTLAPEERTSSWDKLHTNAHEWTAFVEVQPAELAFLVTRVQFRLHPTFKEPVINVDKPNSCSANPNNAFELTRKGWGTFALDIIVTLACGQTKYFSHMLCFDADEDVKRYTVECKLPGVPKVAEKTGSEDFVVIAPKNADTSSTGTSSKEDESAKPSKLSSVFLLTDGLANRGICDTDGIVASMKRIFATSSKITVHTFGFGADHNEEMLAGIARAAGGDFMYVESVDGVASAFAAALGGLLSTVATNLVLQLTPSVGADRFFDVPSSTRSAHEVSEHVPGGLRIELGDCFAGARRDVLVVCKPCDAATSSTVPVEGAALAEEVLITNPKNGGGSSGVLSYSGSHEKVTLGSAQLSYFNVVSSKTETLGPFAITTLESSDWSEVKAVRDAAGPYPNPTIQVQKCRMDVLAVMAQARVLGDARKLYEARVLLADCEKRIEAFRETILVDVVDDSVDDSTAGHDFKSIRGYCDSFIRDLRDCRSSMRDFQDYDINCKKKIMWHSNRNCKQRGGGADEDMYNTNTQTICQVTSAKYKKLEF